MPHGGNQNKVMIIWEGSFLPFFFDYLNSRRRSHISRRRSHVHTVIHSQSVSFLQQLGRWEIQDPRRWFSFSVKDVRINQQPERESIIHHLLWAIIHHDGKRERKRYPCIHRIRSEANPEHQAVVVIVRFDCILTDSLIHIIIYYSTTKDEVSPSVDDRCHRPFLCATSLPSTWNVPPRCW